MTKNILVIGASSGMGKDLSLALLKANHNVYCCARRVDKMQYLQEQGANIYKLDVCDESNVQQVVAEVIKHAGHLDIVYSNSGFAIAGPVEETPIDKVHAQFDTNVYGAARVARAVLPYMREQNSGRIIFTTSIAARISTSMNSWYSASKHALNGMAKGLAQEVADFNIKVITIEPGCVKTEFDSHQLADMVATNNMETYKAIVEKSHDFLADAYGKGSCTQSTVNTMLKAGFANKPKLSYRSTLDAKLMLFAQNLIGEKLMGKAVLKLIKKF
ncbi:SDR family oxidoreductase [Thalassotalea nanhaiensis]|uniref:SDR family oxidoreductase n=1 Tax=Thalassotalea nanhaiensis TaxID=3065648 RepID=A0ABY9TJU3_9GAMM|nr:SDR family oxidoreductase [Colwelliaceae bacterium SQ345]